MNIPPNNNQQPYSQPYQAPYQQMNDVPLTPAYQQQNNTNGQPAISLQEQAKPYDMQQPPQFDQQQYQQPQAVQPPQYQPYHPQGQLNQAPQANPYAQIYQQPATNQVYVTSEYQPQQQQGLGIPIVSPANYAQNQYMQINGQRTSIQTKCPYCGNLVFTRVDTSPGGGTWCMVIVLLCCFWPCFFIPLVSDECKDAVHHCSQCGAELGKTDYKPCG